MSANVADQRHIGSDNVLIIMKS